MTSEARYSPEESAPLSVDPYNDFLQGVGRADELGGTGGRGGGHGW
ncbi:hypothetical protein ACFWPQ_31525 [Streptomyces sp. NPDC058464]